MATSRETGIPRAVAIAWGLVEPPTRGPSRGLSHESIIEAAIDIGDADGLAAVTMQRVAQSLGFTTMSLYRYVASKEELLALALDAGINPPRPRGGVRRGDWRAALSHWTTDLRAAYRARPWLLAVPRTATSVLMPNAMAVADTGLAALQGLSLTDEEKFAVILDLSAFASSFASLEFELATDEDVVMTAAGFAALAEVITPDRLPHLAPLLLAGSYVGGAPDDAGSGVDQEFFFGLERYLDGLGVLAARRAGASAE